MSCLLFAPVAFAQSDGTINDVCSKVQGGQKPAVCSNSGGSTTIDNNSIVGPNGIIVKITHLVATATGVACVFMVMVGGTMYIMSAGDSNKVHKAKNVILYSLAGVLISAFAAYIVGYAVKFFAS